MSTQADKDTHLETCHPHCTNVVFILCLQDLHNIHRQTNIPPVLVMNPFPRLLSRHREVELILVPIRRLLTKSFEVVLLCVVVSSAQDIILVLLEYSKTLPARRLRPLFVIPSMD